MTITVGGTSITFNDGTTQTTAAGTPTTAQVLSATASASVGAVGTYALLGETGNVTTEAGGTRAGSALRYAGIMSSSTTFSSNVPATNGVAGNGGTPSGTWRAMGRSLFYGSCPPMWGGTIWLRIS